MAARAIWKGVLRLQERSVPVKLYAAVEGARSVRFRLLHGKDRTPVRARMVHPQTGKTVPSEQTRRGYVTASGEIVVFEPAELEAVAPEPSRDIDVLRFVPPTAVDHRWYERPYYLGPDGDAAGYGALARALDRTGRVGITRWTMRKKPYVGALRLEEGHPMLVTLRRPGEVVDPSALPRPGGREPNAGEVKMAEQLLHALDGHFEPSEWTDRYRERVMELIEAKAEGKTIPLSAYREKEPEADLSRALRESLTAVRSA